MKMIAPFILAFAAFGCSHKEPDSPATPDHVTPGPEEGKVTVEGMGGKKYYTGLLHKALEYKGLGEVHMHLADCDNLPDSFDLRPLGLVSDIRDQGACGSCWSFSQTGSLESALRGQGSIKDLAEQELVSCDGANWGCDGGLLGGFSYQIDHGQGLESAFPYTSGRTGQNGACKAIPAVAQGVSFSYVGAPDRGPTEKELKCALVKNLTVPWITVGATNAWGNPPVSEHTAYNHCGSTQTNHAIGVVGYWKDASGKTQFIAKNSWGTSWGDKGYMSLPLGCNSFGEEVAFISVAHMPGPTPTPGPDPTPTPCTPPAIKLPALIVALPGVEVSVGIKQKTAGWTYEWYADGVKIPNETEPMIYVTPAKDTVYKLQASSSCGTAQSSVKVALLVNHHQPE